jgi:glycosyltransferase involved in cell wall biosynthesis
MPELTKSLLNENDISSLLNSSRFETVKKQKKIIFPFKFLGLGRYINRFLACMPLFSSLCLRNYVVARSLEVMKKNLPTSASVIIPCRNERGNIRNAIERLPLFTKDLEIIFVEGHSHDGTWDEVKKVIKDKEYIDKGFKMKAIQQPGKGKADAVFAAFDISSKDVLIILDGDLTVPPEDIPKFWQKISKGEGEYINGSRLVYPMENQAMRFLNYIANKLFSLLFTWLLGQRYTDTLCGTKVIRRSHYLKLKKRNQDLGNFDPFGDFFIIFGAARLNLKMIEVPIRYRAREYGETQISRFSHGFLLIKMVIFAFFKLKAI